MSALAKIEEMLERVLEPHLQELQRIRAHMANIDAKMGGSAGALPDPVDQVQAGVLSALRAAFADREFTAAEVIARATESEVLAAALTQAVSSVTPHSLSRYFAKLDGRAIGGLRLERVGPSRDGVLYKVCDFETANALLRSGGRLG